MENQGNPWGMNQGERADWAKGLDRHRRSSTAPRPLDARVPLLGRLRRLLRRQEQEGHRSPPPSCCSAPASTSRSSARPNSAPATRPVVRATSTCSRCWPAPTSRSLNGMGVKKIITQCPHCFNTLQNEYPQLGGNYEVVHHSQFLEHLIDTGKLDMSDASLDERVVYHDSCYLGRHNDVYEAPRRVIGSLKGVDIVEAPRNGNQRHVLRRRRRAHVDGRTRRHEGQHRARRVSCLATGASRVATACPFCYIMIDDGVKEHGRDDVVVADISIHLLDSRSNAAARSAELRSQRSQRRKPAASGPSHNSSPSTNRPYCAICAGKRRQLPMTSRRRPGSSAARGLRGFEGDADEFRAWLFTIARHRLIDERRRDQSAPSDRIARARPSKCRRRSPSPETDVLARHRGRRGRATHRRPAARRPGRSDPAAGRRRPVGRTGGADHRQAPGRHESAVRLQKPAA